MALEPTICHRCGALLAPGKGLHWEVRIEAVRDPTLVLDDTDLLDREAHDKAMEDAEAMSARQAMDSIYRRLKIELCPNCFEQWIEGVTTSP